MVHSRRSGINAESPASLLPHLGWRGAGWLKGLDRDLRLAIGEDLLRVQYRWPVGMPLCRPLGGGLWEVRTSLPDKTISRVLICFHGGTLVALSGFIKKTQKTPQMELQLAMRRRKEVEDE